MYIQNKVPQNQCVYHTSDYLVLEELEICAFVLLHSPKTIAIRENIWDTDENSQHFFQIWLVLKSVYESVF